ncbi:MAG: ExeM/NucH family extracellular endonuclease [Cytophagales bacterium]|nr:MAG: ExeM/NucH family extracellular endonuclease [Cytophagales bacterium]
MQRKLHFGRQVLLGFLLFLCSAVGARAQQIIVNEFYRGGNLTATDEFIEVLLVQDLTAAQLEAFHIGDGTSAVTTKFSAYKLTGMAAIAPIFKAGTLIVLAGATAASQDLSYNPAGGDWNITVTGGGANAANANVGNNGDLAGTDVVWADTSPTGGSVSSNGFAIKWTASTGSFVASVGIPAPANNSGISLTSNLAGATTASNWVSQASTIGQPNGGSNTTYINSLRALAATPTLTANPASLTGANGITYVFQDGPESKTISISGSNFATATGNVTASSPNPNFTVSPTSTTFASASLAATSFTVTLQSGLAVGSTYATTLTFEGGGATAVVPVSGTVTATPPLPNLSINDVSLAEGTSGTTSMTFTVTLSAPAGAGGVTFDIATQDGTATTGNNDYVANSLTSQTIASGQSSYTFTVLVSGDTSSEPNESFSVVVSNVTGANLIDGVGIGTITNDDAAPVALTRIHTIQGTGTAATPGSFTVEGVVVGVFPNLNPAGFYIQEEDADGDGNALTSEGIFVASGASVNVGDRVRVSGTVQENSSTPSFNQAVFTSGSTVLVTGTGQQSAVAPTSVTLPVTAVADLERYEGMLVTFSSLTVSETFSLGRFGELVLSNGRLIQPTNFIDPNDNPATGTTSTGTSNVAAITAQQSLNDRNRILLDDGSAAGNPTTAPYIDPVTKTLRIGSTVSSLTGVLGFGFSQYRIQPTVAPVFTYAARPTVPTVGGTIKVAAFNVLNYFNGNGSGGGFPTTRGANSSSEFTRQRNKIITAISQLNADVVGLIEIENDGDGATSAIADLVNGLNTATAAGTYSAVALANTTGSSGTDEIKVAFIYKPASVSLVGNAVYDNNSVYSRPPLAQTFQVRATGERFTAINNHFKSKGGSGASGADTDQGDGQAQFNATRKAQSTALLTFITQIQTNSGDNDVMVLGDLNAYNEEDPIDVLRAGGLTKLATATESYVFQGQTGSLDHALVTASLLPQVTGTAKWNINSEEPIALDYNDNVLDSGETTGANSDDLRNDVSLFNGTQPFRSSDHDPVLVGLTLGGAVAATLVAAPTTVCEGSPVALTATVAGFGASYSYTITNGTNSTSATGQTSASFVTSVTATATGAFTLTVSSASGSTTTTASGTITVNSRPALPTYTLTNNGTVCAGQSLTAAVNGCNTGTVSFTVNPQTGSGISNPNPPTPAYIFDATTPPGTYTICVRCTVNGCTSPMALTTVTINALPTNVSLTSATITCAVPSVTLTATATGATGYTLSNGQSNTAGSFTVSTGGTYTVTVANASGCTATATATVGTNNAAPTNVSLTSATITCASPTVTLTATGGTIGTPTGYTLSDAQSNTTGNFTVSAGGNYTVIVANVSGCTASATATVTSETALPTPTLVASNSINCTVTSATLTAGGGISYTLSSGVSNTTGSFTITTGGTYTVTVANAAGCRALTFVTVASDVAAPPASLATSGTITCSQLTASLTATGGTIGTPTGYTLSDGQFNTTGLFSVTAGGAYTVRVTGANGCTATSTTVVASNTATPPATLTASSLALCTSGPGASATLTASGGINYAFSGPGLSQNGANATATISQTGTYSVVVTGTNGCTATRSVAIVQNASGVVIGATPGTVNACTGSPLGIPVTVSGPVTAYHWLKGGSPVAGQTTNTLSIPSVQLGDAGAYSLSVVGACGSATSSTITVVVNPTPIIILTFPGGTLTNPSNVPTIQLLTPGQVQVSVSGGTSYEWVLVLDRINGYEIRQAESNTNGVFTISKPGPYRITVNPGSACSRTVEGVIAN